jgi:hypothetical protein
MVTGLHETGHDHFHLSEFTVNTHSVILSHLTYANSKAGPTRLHKLKALLSWLRWFQDNGNTDKLFNARSNNTQTQAPAIKRKVFPYSESSEVPGQRWALNWHDCNNVLHGHTHSIPLLWWINTLGTLVRLAGECTVGPGGGGGRPEVKFNVFGSVHLCKVQWSNKLMQLLIVSISI